MHKFSVQRRGPAFVVPARARAQAYQWRCRGAAGSEKRVHVRLVLLAAAERELDWANVEAEMHDGLQVAIHGVPAFARDGNGFVAEPARALPGIAQSDP